MKNASTLSTSGSRNDISFQIASIDIWDKKYRLKTKSGEALDTDIDHTYQRIARALADAETTPEKQDQWYTAFLWALRNGSNSSWTDRLQCRSTRAQAGHQHDQLHGVRDYSRLDERHPRQDP
jgi:ribonucleotide reductase alpha subunit